MTLTNQILLLKSSFYQTWSKTIRAITAHECGVGDLRRSSNPPLRLQRPKVKAYLIISQSTVFTTVRNLIVKVWEKKIICGRKSSQALLLLLFILDF